MPDIMEYQNLVWSIVNKILKNISDINYRSELENELFQEGFIGLIEAQNNFDKEKDVKFSTFAYQYIKGYCMHYLRKETNVRSKICYLDEYEEIEYENDFYFKDLNIIDSIEHKLKKINKKFPLLDREVLKARIYEGKDYRTIAKTNNCSIKKVYNIMSYYKDIIKNIINENF